MNADRPVSRVRDWPNPRFSHRHICVHLRSSAAKIPFFWINQPKPNAAQQGPGLVHPHAAAMPAQTAPFKPSRIDPMNREPTAKPRSTAPFKPSRIDLRNREPMATPGSTAPFKPFRIDPLNRGPDAVPAPRPRPLHRVHDPAHFRQSARRAALTAPAPQARNFAADERR